jgi:hypothetical protein
MPTLTASPITHEFINDLPLLMHLLQQTLVHKNQARIRTQEELLGWRV